MTNGRRARAQRKNGGRGGVSMPSAYELYVHDFDEENHGAYGDAPWSDGAKVVFAEADAEAQARPARRTTV